MQPSPHGIESETFTPVRMGCQGAVVANHPLAAVAGMGILMDGGNAVDAASATGCALAGTYPFAGNIGGGGFMVRGTADGSVGTFDGRETAPASATPATSPAPAAVRSTTFEPTSVCSGVASGLAAARGSSSGSSGS